MIDVKGKGKMETHFVVPTGMTLPPLEEKKDKAKSVAQAAPEQHANRDDIQLDQVVAQPRAATTATAVNPVSVNPVAVNPVAVSPSWPPTPIKTPDVKNPLVPGVDVSTLRSNILQLSSSAHVHTFSTSDGNSNATLSLELDIKKSALTRARRALMDKDDELDAKELQLQLALIALTDVRHCVCHSADPIASIAEDGIKPI
jgi:hypothetical protein